MDFSYPVGASVNDTDRQSYDRVGVKFGHSGPVLAGQGMRAAWRTRNPGNNERHDHGVDSSQRRVKKALPKSGRCGSARVRARAWSGMGRHGTLFEPGWDQRKTLESMSGQ